ncbi:MAG: phosphotransferase, partial [Congregibacter sp.]|nr:phosphotransferase [Congregibacter sp.]
MTEPALTAQFKRALADMLARQIAGFKGLLDYEQLTAGASQETYRIRLEDGAGERLLALRRSPPSLDTGSVVGSISLETEARLFQLAAAAGIPGPQVHYVLRAEDDLGRGFVMDWLEGETLGQRILRDERLADIR